MARNLLERNYKYISEFSVNYKGVNKLEIENSNFKIKRDKTKLNVYVIEETENSYFSDRIYQKIFENFILNEIEIEVDENFNILKVLNVDSIENKINIVKDEIFKIKYIDKKINRDFLNIEKFIYDEKIFASAITKSKFYNLFLNEVNSQNIDKKIVIFDFLSEGIPLHINKYRKNNKYFVIGNLDSYKLSHMRLNKKFEKDLEIKFNNIEISYKSIVELDFNNNTNKIDRLVEIFEENERIICKRELLEVI